MALSRPCLSSSLCIVSVAVVLSAVSACTSYGGGDKVVIDMSGRATGNWQAGYGGVAFKPWDGNKHSYQWGEGGSIITIDFQVPKTSEYLVSAESWAPHSTEHNDCFLYLPYGATFYARDPNNPNNRMDVGSGPIKAYQNQQSSRYLFTVDHHPHAITTYLQQGQTYQLQVGGRSSKFMLKKLMLIACNGGDCSPYSGHCSSQMNDWTPSGCY